GYASARITSPASCAPVPRPMILYALMNRRNSETARISSGVMTENIITKFVEVGVRPRQRSSASANPTPSGTATTVVSSASLRVWTIACRIAGSCTSETSGSNSHQRSEKPVKKEIDRVELNENTTAVTIGIIVQTT